MPQNIQGQFAASTFNPESFDAVVATAQLKTQYPDDSRLARMLIKEPKLALMDHDLWKDDPYAADLIKVLLKNDPNLILNNKDLVASLPEARQWFFYKAEKNPQDIINSYSKIRDLSYGDEILNEAVRHDPAYALGYAKQLREVAAQYPGPWLDKEPINRLNGKGGIIDIALAQDLQAAARVEPFYILFASELYKSRPDAKKITQIALEKESLMTQAQKEPLVAFQSARFFKDSPYAKDVLNAALEKVEDASAFYMGISDEINMLHDQSDARRFSSIDNESFDARYLYALMTFEAKNLYTSSFRGALNLFLKRIDSDHIDLEKFFQEDDRGDSISTFLESVTNYGRFNDIYQKLSPQLRKDAIVSFLSEAMGPDNIKGAGILANMLNQIHEPAALKDFEKSLIENYESETDEKMRDRLGLLAGSYAQSHKGEFSYPEFFESIGNNPRYKLPDISRMDPTSVYDQHGRNIQLMTFYKYHDGKAEPDGQASYDSFIKTYKSAPDRWRIEDKGSYVHVTSIGGGKQVHIYANKPEYDGAIPGKNGLAAIGEAVEKLQPPIHDDDPFILIHRGHSYHLDKTLKHLGEHTPIVYLGSCGSAQNIDTVLQSSPHAQIIATSGTGTMKVNDPLLFYINDKYLRLGKPIVWDEVWKYVDSLPSPDKKEYIKPSENITAAFIASYYDLHADDRKKTEPKPRASIDTPEAMPAPMGEPSKSIRATHQA